MSVHINPDWPHVGFVVNADLCTQCGACTSMCPHQNIEMVRDEHFRFYPLIKSEEPCINRCKSLCVEVCSGVHEDPSLWKREPIVPKDYEEYCTGPVIETLIGYSTDMKIRSRGTSGGVVTGLLVYLLETGKIDGALIIGSNNTEPSRHDIFIARTRAEIESAWGSKYYPMPIGEHFRNLISHRERFAVVLLGCHMRALRLMERRITPLKRSIVLRIGLICGYCSGYKATADQALEWGMTNLTQIGRVDYRDGKWPGNVRIREGARDEQTLIYNFLGRLPFTTNQRCMVCSDLMNETADITLGDAWLKELTAKKDEGWSVLTIRTARAKDLIYCARRDGALFLEDADTSRLIQSQDKPLRYKKYGLQTRRWFARYILRHHIPNQNILPETTKISNLWNHVGNILFLITLSVFFKRDTLRRLMYRTVKPEVIQWYVRMIFLMIAHDGHGSFLLKWMSKRAPAMNCDA